MLSVTSSADGVQCFPVHPLVTEAEAEAEAEAEVKVKIETETEAEGSKSVIAVAQVVAHNSHGEQIDIQTHLNG